MATPLNSFATGYSPTNNTPSFPTTVSTAQASGSGQADQQQLANLLASLQQAAPQAPDQFASSAAPQNQSNTFSTSYGNPAPYGEASANSSNASSTPSSNNFSLGYPTGGSPESSQAAPMNFSYPTPSNPGVTGTAGDPNAYGSTASSAPNTFSYGAPSGLESSQAGNNPFAGQSFSPAGGSFPSFNQAAGQQH